MKEKASETDPFIAIPAAMGGILMAIVILFLIFQPLRMDLLSTIVWGFVIMVCVSVFFAYKSVKKK
jgi:hypothetical protein